jgi:hypothetical protein
MKKLWIILIVLILISPLSILLPALLGSGSAWGEWSSQQVGEMVGFIPKGMERLEALWKAPFPDYTLPLFGENLKGLSLGYIVSAFLGTLLIVALVYGIGLYMTRGTRDAP